MEILLGDGDSFIFIRFSCYKTGETNHHEISKIWLILHISEIGTRMWLNEWKPSL